MTDRSSQIYGLRSPTVAFFFMQIENRKRIGIGPKRPKYHHEHDITGVFNGFSKYFGRSIML